MEDKTDNEEQTQYRDGEVNPPDHGGVSGSASGHREGDSNATARRKERKDHWEDGGDGSYTGVSTGAMEEKGLSQNRDRRSGR